MKNRSERQGPPPPVMKGMSYENLQLLYGSLRELYGEGYDDLTLKQVKELHHQLVAALDGERKIGDTVISDNQNERLDRMAAVETVIREARAKANKQIDDFEKEQASKVA